MANDFHNNVNVPVTGLGTYNHTITATGWYTVRYDATIPHDPGSLLYSGQTSPFASGLQIQLQQNSTPLQTIGGSSTNPTQSQPAIGSNYRVYCASGDTLSVVYSSSNSIDSLQNAVKGNILLYPGF